jgi:hypothetical protein
MGHKYLAASGALIAVATLSGCIVVPRYDYRYPTTSYSTPYPQAYAYPSQAYQPTQVYPQDNYVQPSDSDQECREFQHNIVIGGRKEPAYGMACRQPDGTWKPMGN